MRRQWGKLLEVLEVLEVLAYKYITLNVNGLNSIIKVRDCQLGLSGPSMCCCLQEINIKYKDTYRLKIQG